MRRSGRAVHLAFLLLLMPSLAWAQTSNPTPPATVTVAPEEAKVVIKQPPRGYTTFAVILDLRGSTGNKFSIEAPGSDQLELIPTGEKKPYFAAVRYPKPGTYVVKGRAIGMVGGIPDEVFGNAVVVVIDKPSPEPPKPPEPDPKPPKPPEPDPKPPVPPNPDEPHVLTKFRVMFVNESSDAALAGSPEVWGSTAIRQYLTTRCYQDVDTRPSWRFWDKDIVIAVDTPDTITAWKAALADTTPLPKMVVFDGAKLVKAIPLPKTEGDAINALQAWGGH